MLRDVWENDRKKHDRRQLLSQTNQTSILKENKYKLWINDNILKYKNILDVENIKMPESFTVKGDTQKLETR